MSFLGFFGICTTPKLSKCIKLSACTYVAIQWVPIDSNPAIFITHAPF